MVAQLPGPCPVDAAGLASALAGAQIATDATTGPLRIYPENITMKAGTLATITWIDIGFNATLDVGDTAGAPGAMTLTFAEGYTTSLSFISTEPERVDVVGVSGTSTPISTVATDGAQVTLQVPVDVSFLAIYNSMLAGQPLEGATNYTLTGMLELRSVIGCGEGCGVNGRCAPLEDGGVGCQCECGWGGPGCSVPTGFCSKYAAEGTASAVACPVLPPPTEPAAPPAPCTGVTGGSAQCSSWQVWNSTAGECQCRPGWSGPGCDACITDAACSAYYTGMPLAGGGQASATCGTDRPYSSSTVYKAYTCDLAGTGLDTIIEPGTFSVACNTTSASGSTDGGGGMGEVTVEDGSFCRVNFAMKGRKENPVSCKSSLCSYKTDQTQVNCQTTTCSCLTACPDLDGAFEELEGQPAIIDCNEAGVCTFDIQNFFVKLEAPCSNQECSVQGYVLKDGAYTYTPDKNINPVIASIPLIALVLVAALLSVYLFAQRRYFWPPRSAAAGAADLSATGAARSPLDNVMGGGGSVPKQQLVHTIVAHELAFTEISSTAPSHDGLKTILDRVSGVARSGDLVGILGPSGSGKTSLLSVLAGSVDDTGSSVTVGGAITLDGTPMDATTARLIAYCAQDTTLLPTLTVEECVRYSALLRLPQETPAENVHAVTAAVISELGLSKVSRSLVGGGSGLRGVSGGERRRVTIAMELVTNPAVLILDEPTSGLDSFSALNMMTTLKNVAGSGRIVMLSFHQPSPAMFNLLDRVFLLVQGRCIFSGPPAAVEDHFARLGLPCPSGTGAAEHMLRCGCDPELLPMLWAATQPGSGNGKDGALDGALSSSDDVEVDAAVKGSSAPLKASGGGVGLPAVRAPPRCSFARELAVMFWRTGIDIARNPILLLLHWLMALGMGIFVGCVFLKVDLDVSGAQNRAGGMIFALAFFAFSSLTTVDLVMHERRLVGREVRGGYYHPASYLVSKAVLDALLLRAIPVCLYTAPFYPMMGLQSGSLNVGVFITVLATFAVAIGALSLALSVGCRTAGEASLAMNLVLLICLLNSGFFVNVDYMEDWISWLHYASPFFYGYAVLITNEMSTLLLDFVVKGYTAVENVRGTTFLEIIGIDPTWMTTYIIILDCMYVGFLLLAFALLYWRMPRAARLRAVPVRPARIDVEMIAQTQLRLSGSLSATTVGTQRLPVKAQAAAHFASPISMFSQGDSNEPPSSCEWPRSCTWPRGDLGSDTRQQHSGFKSMFDKLDTDLPPEVERMALFADDPSSSSREPSESWWTKLWRYQGLGL